MYQSRMLRLSRRDVLRGAATIGVAGCFGAHRAVTATAPPLETTTIRLVHAPSICTAPQYIAEEFLRLDGFTDVQYLPLGTRNGPYALADGRGDIAMWDAPGLIPHLDAGKPIVLLAGVHAGCYELFGREEMRAIRDLKGKTVAIQYVGGGDQVLISSMLAYIGINPQHEVTWIAGESVTRRHGLVRRGQGRRLSRLRAAARGVTPEAGRARHRRHRPGPALVPILLLHGRRQP